MKLSFNQSVEILRTNDITGGGSFGDPRGSRTHKGVDLLYPVGAQILAPFKLRVTKIGLMYNPVVGKQDMKYTEFTGFGLLSVFKVRVGYIDSVPPIYIQKGDVIAKGDIIGIVQNISGYHGAPMKNHIHVEVYLLGKLIDPTSFIKFS